MRHRWLLTLTLSAVFVVLNGVQKCSRADVLRWDNGHLLASTIGVTLGPGVQLDNRHLAYAELFFQDLTEGRFASSNLQFANFQQSTLTNADFTESDLRDAFLYYTALDGAAFNGAVVNNARFDEATQRGFVRAQLYSTRSYQEGDLTGIGLRYTDLAGWDFNQKNLSKADLSGASLANTDISGAIVESAAFSDVTSRGFKKEQLYSTASYQTKQLGGISLATNNLTNWDFSNQDLTGAAFANATLSFTKFDDAEIVGATFYETTSRAFHPQQLYSTASYKRGDLRGVEFGNNDLRGWDFSGQDLRKASFTSATLTNADFTNAVVAEAQFGNASSQGLAKEQLYSTASYQAKDLHSIVISGADLRGWDFSGQNLTGAYLGSRLDGASFAGAIIRNALLGGLSPDQLYSTASYQLRDLRGLAYSNGSMHLWNLREQDLRGADFSRSRMSTTDFSDARIEEVRFNAATSFRAEQLYSTASYKLKSLRGVGLYDLNLKGWDFRGQDLTHTAFGDSELTGAQFEGALIAEASLDGVTALGFTREQLYSTASYQNRELPRIGMRGNDLDDWDFQGQNLMNSAFQEASLDHTDFRNADLRGVRYADFSKALTRGAILPDGSIAGLSLIDDERLVIRNYRFDDYMFQTEDPITVLIRDELAIDGGTLEFRLDSRDWNSTVSFQPDVAVSINGTLELSFADGVDVAPLAGNSFRLFDWNGVESVAEFSVKSSYAFDTSELHSSGYVTLVSGLLGDANGDNRVDIEDLNEVRNNFGQEGVWGRPGDTIPFDGIVDLYDLNNVRNRFGTVNPVPEPTSLTVVSIGVFNLCAATMCSRLRRRCCQAI